MLKRVDGFRASPRKPNSLRPSSEKHVTRERGHPSVEGGIPSTQSQRGIADGGTIRR